MVTTYKKGAFVHIVRPNPSEWGKSLESVRGLPGVQHVELWVEDIPDGNLGFQLRALTRGIELTLHGPFLHGSVVTHVDEIAELTFVRWVRTLELADLLQAKVVTFHAGTYPSFDSRQTALARLVRRFGGLPKSERWVVTLENMPFKRGAAIECLGNLSDLRTVKMAIPDIKFTLDIGHCLQNGEDFNSFIREEVSSIENIHLHDGVPGGRSHLALGAGSLDLPNFLLLLREVGYSKFISLETISVEDTSTSWQKWLDAEVAILA